MSRDFDFQFGEWRVSHRKLKERLVASDEWWEFDGECSCRPTLGGIGNVEDNLLNQPDGGYRAMAVRRFNPTDGLWSIWWLDERASDIEPPVRGRFDDGVGVFTGDDVFQQRPIRVRFIWSEITSDTAKWEQAFSPDAGATWETNWIMHFQRMGGR